eukprot:106869_1
MEEHKDLLDTDQQTTTSPQASQRTLSAVCGHSNARNISIYLAIYASCGIAGGVAIPLLGASWFGDCLESDGKTIIDNPEICDPDYRTYNVVATISWSLGSLMSFLFAGFCGRLSDSFGRKLLIGLCLLSVIIPRVLIIFYVNFFVYFAVSIFMDVPSAVYSAAIADMFPDSTSLKTVAYAIFTAMSYGFGLFFGATITLVVSSIYDNHTVFIAIGIIYALLIPYYIFLIKETLDNKNRKQFTTKNYNPFRPLLHIFDNKVITYNSIHAFIASFEDSTVLSMTLAFAGDQFNMKSEFETNLVFSLVSVIGGIGVSVQGLILMPIFKRHKVKNITIMIFGNIVRIIGLYMLAMTPIVYDIRYETYFISSFLLGIGSVASPANTGIASEHLFKNEQGIGLGIIRSYSSIGGIIAPGLMGWIYFYFTTDDGIYLPSMPWYICTGLKVVSLLIVIGPFNNVLKNTKNKKCISVMDLEKIDATSAIEMEKDDNK